MMNRICIAGVVIWLGGGAAIAADLDCPQHLPYGAPRLEYKAHTTPVCKTGYFALHDDDFKIPRYVSYVLTRAHTFGCEARANRFHAEASLPKGRRAVPADYAGSGYDKGHLSPAADQAWSKAASLDSFSMANMTPQKGGLNRQQWERLEETVRSWADKRGELLVYVGPVVSDHPKTIGKNDVAVPNAFWKVLVDAKGRDALAFLMPNRTVRKGPLAPWQTSVAEIEREADVVLPTPAAVDHDATSKLWPADIAGWTKKHNEICGR